MGGPRVPLVWSVGSSDTLECLLPDFPLALVEIPQLAPGHNFFELRAEPFAFGQVLRERALEPGALFVARLFDDGVGAQPGYFSSYETDRFVQRIGESVAGIAANYKLSFLSHEPGHVAAITANQYRPALHRDTEPRGCIAVNHNRSAANRRRGTVARTAAHNHLPGQHRFREAPSRAARDLDRRTID